MLLLDITTTRNFIDFIVYSITVSWLVFPTAFYIKLVYSSIAWHKDKNELPVIQEDVILPVDLIISAFTGISKIFCTLLFDLYLLFIVLLLSVNSS